jgi:hypothetical protein
MTKGYRPCDHEFLAELSENIVTISADQIIDLCSKASKELENFFNNELTEES